MDRKRKLEELGKLLRERKGSLEVTSIMEVIELKLDEVKEQLLTCDEDEFRRLQGEAQAYEKLTRLLTRKPLSLTP